MNKIYIPVIISIFFLCGCTKHADNSPAMNAFIDATQLMATGNNIVSTVNTTANPSQLIMTGTSETFSPGTTFAPAIKIVVTTTIGTYNIGTNSSAVAYTPATGSIGTSAIYGQINVVSNGSGKIKGNFNFTCADGTKITNGEFTANN
jgi:hypothetical protein